MKRNRYLWLLLLAPLLLMGIGPFLASGPVISTTSTPVLGGELFSNVVFTDTAGWTGVNATLSAVSSKLRVTNTDASGRGIAVGTTVSGGIYKLRATGAFVSGTDSLYQLAVSNNADGSSNHAFITSTAGSIVLNAFATSTTTYCSLRNNNADTVHDWSGASFKAYSLPSLLAPTRPFSGSGRFYTTPTTTNCATGEWLGTAAYLDSATSPTKGLFAYLNRTTGNAELRVLTAANTWTSLINTAVTFSSGAQLVLVVDHELMKAWLFYNNAIVGTAQDISAYPWVKQHRKHAIFSTTAVTPLSVTYDFGQMVLGSDLATDGSMEANPAVNWLCANGTYAAVLAATGVTKYSGTQSLQVFRPDANKSVSASAVAITATTGGLYKASGQLYGPPAGSYALGCGNTNLANTVTASGASGTAWTELSTYYVSSNTTIYMGTALGGIGTTGWCDNLSLRRVQ